MPPAAIGAGALIGGVAGSQEDVIKNSSRSGVDLAPASQEELYGKNLLMSNARSLEDLVSAGPGKSDVSASTDATRSFASMLDMYAKNGAMPTAQDISQGNDIAAKLFQAQRVGLNQAFEDQNVNYARQAALMGREQTDPILRAKLAQDQTRQQALLNANQSAYANQYALNQPFQRLDFTSQRANVLGGLASQAMANRQALAAMGEGIMNNERNFRLATATHWGTGEQRSGGGLKGALMGAMAGAGAGASIASGMGGPSFQQPAPPASYGGTMGPNQGPQIPSNLLQQRQQAAFVGPMPFSGSVSRSFMQIPGGF